MRCSTLVDDGGWEAEGGRCMALMVVYIRNGFGAQYTVRNAVPQVRRTVQRILIYEPRTKTAVVL